jgi:hypothetical protein
MVMKTIENAKVGLFGDGRIAYIQLPDNPDYETMMVLGKGQPCHNTTSLSLRYELQGITYFLHR